MKTFQVALVLTFDAEEIKTIEEAERVALKKCQELKFPFAGQKQGKNFPDVFVDVKYDDWPL